MDEGKKLLDKLWKDHDRTAFDGLAYAYSFNDKQLFTANKLRGVLFIVRAGGDINKAEFMHTKRTNCLTKMKIGIHLVKLK